MKMNPFQKRQLKPNRSNHPLALWILLPSSLMMNSCLMINRGVQQTETLLAAIAGVILLYVGIRLLTYQLFSSKDAKIHSVLRFFIGFTAGIMIFLA